MKNQRGGCRSKAYTLMMGTVVCLVLAYLFKHTNLFRVRNAMRPLDSENLRPLSERIQVSYPQWSTFEVEGRNAMNPSCVWTKNAGKMKCVIRTVDYHLDITTGTYHWSDESNGTINYLVEADPENFTHFPKVRRLLTSPEALPSDAMARMTHVKGFEDIKLFWFGGHTYGVATSFEYNEYNTCGMVILHLNGHNITQVYPLKGLSDHECHKNWMPFMSRNYIRLVAYVDPMVIVVPEFINDSAMARVEYVSEKTLFPDLRLRGTSNGINFGPNAHLFLVHETISRGQKYQHRFMHIRQDYGKWHQRLSDPFYLIDGSVEFPLSLMMDFNQTYLLIGFGFRDTHTGMVRVDIGSPEQFMAIPTLWKEEE